MVVSQSPLKPAELKGKVIAVPGLRTTAYLILKLVEQDFSPLVVPFDKIFEAVTKGQADAGLIIHEGQLTYAAAGLQKVCDLGEWWHKETRLPLPLGGNLIRKDLGPELMAQVSAIVRKSIQYALDHREQALNYAMQFAREMDPLLADKFVGMYVNERTLSYGETERKAVQFLLNKGYEKRIIDHRVQIEFAD
jgi:1,4-dihydroxy-6-naphthoate synthase